MSLLDAVDWILRQCVEAAVIAAMFHGVAPRRGVRIEGLAWYGNVPALDWSQP